MGMAITLRMTAALTDQLMTPGRSPAPKDWLANVSSALEAPMMKNLDISLSGAIGNKD